MKKGLFVLYITMCFCLSCGKRQAESSLALSKSVSTTLEEHCLDTLNDVDSSELFFSPVEEKVFYGEDGIFEEFLYDFLVDTLLQKERIRFPLAYMNMGHESLLEENACGFLSMLYSIDVYHTLVERDAEMEAELDTAMKHVKMECLDMDNLNVLSFNFDKKDGRWFLTSVHEQEISSYKYKDFYSFYLHFVTDSLYQSTHVNDPMTFVTIDPEDEFSIIEANIDMEQWFAFRPALPEHLLVNVDYGVKPSRRPKKQILTCKSLGGNFSYTSYFRKINGEWMLTRFEDMSN